jgi:hypothetical protein
MSRPNKSGLDYFPLDVSLDEKMELVEAKHGLLGFAVIVKLYQNIYKNGYFMDATEDHLFLFKRKVNVDINLINDIINDACRWGVFDEAVYRKYEVLTSRGIQKRFIEASKRRKQVDFIREYVILKDIEKCYSAEVNVNIYSINGNTTGTETPINTYIGTQSKEEKSKELKTYPQKEPVFAVDEVGFAVDEEPQIQPQTSIVTPSTNGKSYVGVVGKKKVTLKGDLFYSFERFWDAFDYRKGKAEAAGAWYELNPDPDLADKIIQSAKTEAQERPDLVARNKNPKWAQGWLNLRRWDDEPTSDYQPEQPTFAPPPYWKEIN